MNYVNGVIYGAGFTTGAVIILVIIQKLFGVGICH